MTSNVREAVPFLRVTDMTASVQFYERLGFQITQRWQPQGSLRWCRLEHGTAALMLQDHRTDDGRDLRPEGTLGLGVSICLMCGDALAILAEAERRGLAPAQEPFVGNGLWVVGFVDPDGYRIDFESPTEVPEETTLSAWRTSDRSA